MSDSIDFPPGDGPAIDLRASHSSITDRLRLFGKLRQAKQLLESQLREVGDKMDTMEGMLLEDMALAGIKSINVDGQTFYQQREFFCRGKDGLSREQIAAAFIENGATDLLMPSYQSLRAIVREKAEAGEEIDARIAAVMEIGDKFRLRVRG